MSGDRLPNPTPPFAGTVGRLLDESEAVPFKDCGLQPMPPTSS